MNIKNFTSGKYDKSGRSGFFNLKVETSGTDQTDAYAIPDTFVNSIACKINGDATLYATIANSEDVRNDEALWEEWDGIRQFNNAITHIYIKNNSGDSVTIINVRGTM